MRQPGQPGTWPWRRRAQGNGPDVRISIVCISRIGNDSFLVVALYTHMVFTSVEEKKGCVASNLDLGRRASRGRRVESAEEFVNLGARTRGWVCTKQHRREGHLGDGELRRRHRSRRGV
jgi:hypothetical protein